jgi:putative DNA primase/helicase
MKQFPEHPDGGQAKSSHRERCDKERLFLEETYERGADSDYEESTNVYKAYREWCSENGHRAMNEGNFADAVLRVFGCPKLRTRKKGVRLVVYEKLKPISMAAGFQ